MWALPSVAIFATMLARNTELFTKRYYEAADFAADSILVQQARHFTLLFGNYSRDLFNHPGPAYLYVMAAGQELFYNLLHLVPTPWNGQVIGLYVINSALVGLAVFVAYGWAGYRGALATMAVLLAYSVLHTGALTSAWPPYQDPPLFATFLIAASSVAARRGSDTWVATLAGWLLIHRYAAMLLFVPALSVVVLAAVAWPERRRLPAALRDLARARSIWVAPVLISALFALPIALDVILHWPGQFGKYIAYDSGSKSGGHSFAAVLHYVLWYWGPGKTGWVVIAALTLAAVGATLLTRAPVRRYLNTLLILDIATSVLFLYYATTGIDEINEEYIGYFYWAVPMVAALIIVLAVLAALPGLLGARSGVFSARRTVPAITACAAVAALAVFAAAPGTQTNTRYVDPEFERGPGSAMDPGLPNAVRQVAADAHGATVVIYLKQLAWPSMTGFVVQAERTGVPVCLADPWWTFMVTSDLICTPAQLKNGARFDFLLTGTHDSHTIAVLKSAVIVPYATRNG